MGPKCQTERGWSLFSSWCLEFLPLAFPAASLKIHQSVNILKRLGAPEHSWFLWGSERLFKNSVLTLHLCFLFLHLPSESWPQLLHCWDYNPAYLWLSEGVTQPEPFKAVRVDICSPQQLKASICSTVSSLWRRGGAVSGVLNFKWPPRPETHFLHGFHEPNASLSGMTVVVATSDAESFLPKRLKCCRVSRREGEKRSHGSGNSNDATQSTYQSQADGTFFSRNYNLED